MLCMALPALQAQVDTSRLGDSWMLFPPKKCKMVSYKYIGEFPLRPFDTANCDIAHVDDDPNSIPADTIYEMPDAYDSVLMDRLSSRYLMAFKYSDTVDRVVYGISVTMNAYKTMPWTKELYCTRGEYGMAPHLTQPFGIGDSGYYPFLATRGEQYYDFLDMYYATLERICHLGLLDGAPDGLASAASQRGKLRISRFIYEFDTISPNDTMSLFEFYFDSAFTMKAGEVYYVGQYYPYRHWFDRAPMYVMPRFAKPMCPNYYEQDTGYVWGEPIKPGYYPPGPDLSKYVMGEMGIGICNPWSWTCCPNHITPSTTYSPGAGCEVTPYPWMFPIIELRCTTPRQWAVQMEHDTARLSWQHFDGAEGYELVVHDVTAGDSSLVQILGEDSISYLLGGLDTANHFDRMKLRKLCRYTTESYDTIVRSDWTDVLTLGSLPQDTTGTDTTGIDTTGIALAEGDLRFGLQPNPASASVTLTFDGREGGTVSITDMAGREVLTQSLLPGKASHTIDISRLAAGTYMVRVATPTATGIRRLAIR